MTSRGTSSGLVAMCTTTYDVHRGARPGVGLAGPGIFEHMSERPPEDQTTTDATSAGETLGAPTPEPGAVRDPESWVTGDEPMTGPQRSYLDNLARQAGEELPADLTKAQASEHIDRLQQKVDGAGEVADATPGATGGDPDQR